MTSHLRVGDRGPANRVGRGTADVLLAFDLLVAADPKGLTLCSPTSTAAVVSTSETPTGTQVSDVHAAPTTRRPSWRGCAPASPGWSSWTRSVPPRPCSAPRHRRNLLLVGAAHQLGALPFSAAAVEEAIELNGVAVAANVAASRWGRVAVADAAAFAAAVSPAAAAAARVWDLGRSPLAGETRRLVEVRAELLRRHTGARAARA